MTRNVRLAVFFLAMLALVPAAFRLAVAIPTFGAHALPYGDAINAGAPKERHVTNAVTAVNFDYRGFDTLGEEFMLLAAVTGVVVLLRGTRGEHLGSKPGLVDARRIQTRNDAMVLVCRTLCPLTVLFGIYVSIHASTTPGGGFQGGVIIATGLLMIYLGERYTGWRTLVHSKMLDWFEGGGALLFALVGFAALFAGQAFASNFLPLGELKSALSGGTMFVANIGVAFAVAGSFTLIFVEFLEETRRYEPGDIDAEDEQEEKPRRAEPPR